MSRKWVEAPSVTCQTLFVSEKKYCSCRSGSPKIAAATKVSPAGRALVGFCSRGQNRRTWTEGKKGEFIIKNRVSQRQNVVLKHQRWFFLTIIHKNLIMKKRGLNHLMSKIADFIIKKKLCLAWPTRMVLCKKNARASSCFASNFGNGSKPLVA